MSTEILSSWPREFYQPGGGGSAFLFYVVFGDINTDAPLSRQKYGVGGMPEALDLQQYSTETHPGLLQGFREGYVWEEFQRESPRLAAEVLVANACMVVRGEFGDPDSLNYLRDTVGLITWLLDGGGLAVYDLQILRWWSAEEWRGEIWKPGAEVVNRHVALLVSPEEKGTEWFHTRGMRKFGRPDLSVPGVKPEWRGRAIDLCQRFIRMQALGGVIAEGQEIRMASVPEGLTCHHAGDEDDPDFNNSHISIHA